MAKQKTKKKQNKNNKTTSKVEKKQTKKPVNTPKSKGKEIPTGLKSSSAAATKQFEEALKDDKKRKNRKKNKKRGMTVSRFMWIVVILTIIGTSIFAAYYIFDDYFDDSSTPAVKSTEKLSAEHVANFEQLGLDIPEVESITVDNQGPVIYTIYTIAPGTTRERAVQVITTIFNEARRANPQLFETYDFQITVTTSGEEPEGVNDYPIIGANNMNAEQISWMNMQNNYVVPPIPETTE